MPRGKAQLVVQSGPLRGKAFPLPLDGQAEIGREGSCLVRLDGKGVSRRHAVLVGTGEGHLVRDLGSRNGTHVNGQPVREQRLKPQDAIRIGELELLYSIELADPWVGKTVGGHQIEARLGGGGMGTVYRARQISMNRQVALKILSRELSEDHEFIARFIKEARAAAQLSHPNVVQVHNVGEDAGVYFLSMEYISGGTLQAVINREGALPPTRALPMIIAAAKALAWAEENGIVHCDIKPPNLLLDERGQVKVVDFGIAADLRRDRAAGGGSKVAGTPYYMAPEQAKGKPVDHRTDLYALGCTLYAALTGTPPFNGQSAAEVLRKKMREEPPPLGNAAPGVPPDLAAVVRRLMAREPAARFQGASEVVSELSRILVALLRPEAPRKPSPLPVKPGARRRRGAIPRQRRSIWSQLAPPLALCFLLAGLFYWFYADDRTRTRSGGGSAGVGAAVEDSAPPTPAAPPGEMAPEGPPKGKENDGAALAREQALGRFIEGELEPLILESRFAEARRRLDAFKAANPQLAPQAGQQAAVVQAAETLYEARREAMRSEKNGDHESAAAALEKVADSLPEPFAGEARLAIKVIKEAAGNERP